MLYRRIAGHVKGHNWFAVAIDLVVVVLGVFIGLQVQEWSTARQARTRGDTYSARLTDDLRYEAWNYEYQIAYYKDVHENAERTLAAIAGGRALSDEQFVISAYRASQYIFNETRRSAYDEMTATGDIDLIADPRLRETAFSTYTNPAIQLATEARYSEYRHIFRRAMPADVQHALLENCGDRVVEPGDFIHMAGSINYDCSLDLPAATIAGRRGSASQRPRPPSRASASLRGPRNHNYEPRVPQPHAASESAGHHEKRRAMIAGGSPNT
jgi:hypothetical protein